MYQTEMCVKMYPFFLRQHLWFTGTTFHGYEDTGDGPGSSPSTQVMLIMVTALNMSLKIPVAYFLIPNGFSAEKRADLLRTCIFHLNNSGAVVTNIVMDNCPVNYATFRRLGCHLVRKYQDIRTATDMKNIAGKYVCALFDPPHLSKLGKYCKSESFLFTPRFSALVFVMNLIHLDAIFPNFKWQCLEIFGNFLFHE